MSAVFGLLRRDGEMAATPDLKRMAGALAHFARDGAATIVLGELGLGTCRTVLRAVDRLEGEPLSDPETGITIAAAARLDERERLGTGLGLDPADLARLSDSALILRAHRRWGDDFATHLLGDFVVAVWDERRRRLLLARDHMGQRDLFYHAGDSLFGFAPDVTALWSIGAVPRVLDDGMLCRALTHDFTSTPGATMFDGIRSLSGGHMLIVEPGKAPIVRSYWRPAPDPAHVGRDEAYYVEAFARVLGDAVAARLDGLVRPPGLLLSGGYDSAAIAGLARAPLDRVGQRLVCAASVMPAGYTGTIRHGGYWVDLCARDMPWIEVRRETREGLDPLEGLERRLAERQILPSANDAVNDALRSTLAAAGVCLAMDGHGGDYTLTPRGEAALARWLAQGRFHRFGREIIARRRVTGTSLAHLMRHEVIPYLLPRWLRQRRTARALERRGLPVQAAFVAQAAIEPRQVPIDPIDMRARLVRTLDLVRAGSGSGTAYARHGLVLSRPFHDRRVIELALAIPQDLYVKHGRSRHLARAALRDVYPIEFQRRPPVKDDLVPDFQATIERAGARLSADLDRMEASASLSEMIDFSRLRALLGSRGADEHASGWEADSQAAMNAYMVARYVEWFRRNNG